jgi:hypothetical protein
LILALFAWSAALGKILIVDNLRQWKIVVVDWCCMCKKSERFLGPSPAVLVISRPLLGVFGGVGSGLSSLFGVGGFDSSFKLDMGYVGGPLLLPPRPILLSSTVTGCSPQFLLGMSWRASSLVLSLR